MSNIMCFSGNLKTVESAFRDYMYHYLGGVEKREGYTYDNTISFAEKEKKMNKLMLNDIYRIAGISMSENPEISTEMWSGHPVMRWASFAVVNTLIDMIIPDVINRSMGIYTETRFGSMGDSQYFEIEPNDLFYVSKHGRNQRAVEFQRQFAGGVTIVPENREITVAVNFYKVLCGKESLARFVMKAALSLESQITREAYTGFDTAMSALPNTANSGLRVAGYSEDEAIRLAQTVTAYNNNAKAVFLGTTRALRNLLPNNANYRYDLQSEYVTLGYNRTMFDYDVMSLPQIANWNSKYTCALADNKIYIVSPSSQKLLKLFYEGSTYTNSTNAQQSADLTETTTINKSYGMAIATNAIAGIITLS